ELHELMACGKELGLKGSALKEWVDQERENTRAARAQEQERSVKAEHRSLELRIRLQELQNASPIPVTTSSAENGTGTTLWKSPQHRYLEAQEQEPARREEATADSVASGSRPTSNVSGRVKGGYVELRDGTKVPVVNAVFGTSRLMGEMPVAAGRLHGQAVTVLRDTGCNTVVVRRSLVPDDNLTGT
ncbi:hypothetical protein HPB47_008246, partial [Ixodes persulcatus]